MNDKLDIITQDTALFDIDDLEELPTVIDDIHSVGAALTAKRIEEIKANLALLDAKAAELKARLAQEQDRIRGVLPPGVSVQVGDYVMRRTEVAATERFSLRAMREAGETLPKKLERFVNLSGAHERWTVKRAAERTSLTKKD